MYWEHLWVRLAISSEKTTSVRVLETSKRLAWTAYNGQPFVYEAMPVNETVKPNPSGGMVRSSGQMADEQLPPEVWTRCLDSLGSDGWELVTVTRSLATCASSTSTPMTGTASERVALRRWAWQAARAGTHQRCRQPCPGAASGTPSEAAIQEPAHSAQQPRPGRIFP